MCVEVRANVLVACATPQAPHKFKSRLLNQAKMAMLGVPNTGALMPCCGRRAPELSACTRLLVQSRPPAAGEAPVWEQLELPPNLKAIILVNIRSHGAGRARPAPAPSHGPLRSLSPPVEACSTHRRHAGVHVPP